MMLETDRLILRPFREEDAEDVFEYLKEPMVNCFACMKLNSLEEARKAVQQLCEKLGMRREGLFREFASFVSDADGNPIYENTMQYAILKKEWDLQKK